MKNFLVLMLFSFSAIQTYGHVNLLSPEGGETFTIGDVVQVNWEIVISHDTQNWDLFFSPDGGSSWVMIQEDIAPGLLTYAWTVAEGVTTQGQLKIVMDNVGEDYEGSSGNFAVQSNQNALLIPDTLSGTNIDLTLQQGTFSFFDGNLTNTLGMNGDILGPTLIMNKGEFVNITVDNQIGETTTIHWHGMHVSARNDGGPHTTIAAGEVWNPQFTVLDKAATFWYHPHLHEKTNEHVSKGMAGMIIVRDEEEAALALPRTYGEDDFPIIIQTKDFDNDNQIIVPSNSDDIVMVNATIDPVLSVPAQVVRLRLLNGSSMRSFNIGLNDNQMFYQIASDGGLLSNAVPLSRLPLAPGERAEILIDFASLNGQTAYLMSYASEFQNGIFGATNPGMMAFMTLTGYNPNPLNGADFNLLQFDVVSPNGNPVTLIPTDLVTLNPFAEASADTSRSLTFSPAMMGPNQLNGDFLINNSSFNLNVIDHIIPLNNTEIWSITNQSAIAHPFHIHDVQFYVLDRGGNPPPPGEQGLKDVIFVKPQETVRFITKFEDFADEEVPYMYHCHMLYHEDRGMMGQFLVIDYTTNTTEYEEDAVAIYPNPVSNQLTISGLEPSTIELYNAAGQLLERRETVNDNEQIDMTKYANGVYYFNLISAEQSRTYKVIKN